MSDSDCSFRSGYSSASASVIVDLKGIGADEINLLVGELLQAQSDQKRADEEEQKNVHPKSLSKPPGSESNGTGTTAI